jgi:hypothetical protein
MSSSTTESVAMGILDGLEKGEEDIFPDPESRLIAEGWRTGAAKALERQFAAFVQRSDFSDIMRLQKGGTYVPSMHRKHSGDGHRSRSYRRNSGGVHRQVQKIFQRAWFRSV